MSRTPAGQPGYAGGGQSDLADRPPPPGQGPVILAALAIGVTLMAIQLWLLTVALDLYLAGTGGEVWQLAVASGLIFLGGLAMLWLLHRRPSVHLPGGGEAGPYGQSRS